MNPKKIKTEPIKTVLVITVGMIVLNFVFKQELFLYIALVVGVAGVASNFLAEKINFVWMKLTWILSMIVPNILMSVIFYIFLTPLALFSKLFGAKNKLFLKNTSSSLFRDYEKTFDKSSFEKPW